MVLQHPPLPKEEIRSIQAALQSACWWYGCVIVSDKCMSLPVGSLVLTTYMIDLGPVTQQS